MAEMLFNPYQELIFDDQFCFLTGALTTEKMTVFPKWLMQHFKLEEEKVEMMDKTKTYHYQDLQLPCSTEVKKAFLDLDAKVKVAYDKGYEGMAALEEEDLFLWTGRIVYGLLYYEMLYERDTQLKKGKDFQLSLHLRDRFGKFHLMLQSIIEPVKFVGKRPWSIVVFPLKYSADIFSYRDDPISLMFSFGVNGFGFIACLQDNGIIKENQKETLEKMKDHVLHPIQFEELYARFHYLDYIMQHKPQQKIENTDDGISIEAIQPKKSTDEAIFGLWNDDLFAQLLANYWQVYGIERENILRFQKPPLSFLENPYTKEFIDPETIKLPF